MNTTIHCTINGTRTSLRVDIRQSLMEALREQAGLLSIKKGCAVGECGACTVLIDDAPIDSCIHLAVWADGKSIRTVEGEVKEGRLSKTQQAYVDQGAVQCGFCTPGFIMTSTAFVEEHAGKDMTREEIRGGHSGNLCRCTGYDAIVDAVEQCFDKEKIE